LIERRALRWLFFFYCLFILYGTFIPFRFNADASFVQERWQQFFAPPFAHGIRRFSRLDVISNVLLFVPFGFLWIGSQFGGKFFARALGAFLGTGLVGGLFAFFIELGQLYSPGRTASILDALSNGTGAAFGGLAGHVIFTTLRGALSATFLGLVRRRPALLLLILLMIVPLADAFYPFEITLDVSTAWENLKHTQWLPFIGGFHRFWLDLLVEKVAVFAAIAYLLVLSFEQSGATPHPGLALFLCFVFAFCVEAGKLGFVGRFPNAENFLLSAAGALLGVLVITPITRTRFCRDHALGILLLITFSVMAYAELSPFDWISNTQDLALRWQRIEWMPLGAYYGADPQSALFDLGKKLFIAGPIGLILAARQRGGARILALAAGLLGGFVLETAQIFLRTRTPSITDVLLFGAAAWIGAVAFAKITDLRDSAESPYQPSLTTGVHPR